MANILITGAAGTIGKKVTKHLKDKHSLTLVDVSFSSFEEELRENVKIIEADLDYPQNWKGLLEDIEYVIQLAGEPDAFAEFYGDLLEMNYQLPHNLYKEALEAENLKRIIFASSIHAVSAYPDSMQIKESDPIRPGDLYGVSKVYLEALATYYAYNHNVQSIGIRIADYKADNEELSKDADVESMSMFFSAKDMNHLIDCCLTADLQEPLLVVNGISKNKFSRLSYEKAKDKLGYQPQDDAFEMNDFF